jgi:hypothetical protein
MGDDDEVGLLYGSEASVFGAVDLNHSATMHVLVMDRSTLYFFFDGWLSAAGTTPKKHRATRDLVTGKILDASCEIDRTIQIYLAKQMKIRRIRPPFIALWTNLGRSFGRGSVLLGLLRTTLCVVVVLAS